MNSRIVAASGWPGIPARWTSSAKSGVGTSLGHESRLWFTLSHGIVNEVFYPRIDRACIRDLGFIVTDAGGFFSEEKRHATHSISCTENGVPAFRLLNSCTRGRYRIEKDICCDPHRPALLQRIRLTPLVDPKDALRLFVLLAPHLGNRGAGNTGWVDEYKGVPMLFAERDGSALALACSVPWLERTVGFVGSSDGWRDLHAHGQLTSPATRAENGNVALSAQIDLARRGSLRGGARLRAHREPRLGSTPERRCRAISTRPKQSISVAGRTGRARCCPSTRIERPAIAACTAPAPWSCACTRPRNSAAA